MDPTPHHGRRAAKFTDDSRDGVRAVMAGAGYQRGDMGSSMPRPADPDHRIDHDALLSPGGVAGKVGGFYRAPEPSQYGQARQEAAAIKARMAGGGVFGGAAEPAEARAAIPRPADPDHRIAHDALLSPGGVAGKVGGFYRAPEPSQYDQARQEAAAIKARMSGGAVFGAPAASEPLRSGRGHSRPNSASRAPWGMAGDMPEPIHHRQREAAPWAVEENKQGAVADNSGSPRRRGRGRGAARASADTDHISFGSDTAGYTDKDQRGLTAKVGAAAATGAADMAAYASAREEAAKHKQRQRGAGLW